MAVLGDSPHGIYVHRDGGTRALYRSVHSRVYRKSIARDEARESRSE